MAQFDQRRSDGLYQWSRSAYHAQRMLLRRKCDLGKHVAVDTPGVTVPVMRPAPRERVKHLGGPYQGRPTDRSRLYRTHARATVTNRAGAWARRSPWQHGA